MLGRGLIGVVVVGRVAGYVWRRFPILTSDAYVFVEAGCDQQDVLSFAVGLRREVLLVRVCCIGDVCCCRLWWKVGRLMLPGI